MLVKKKTVSASIIDNRSFTRAFSRSDFVINVITMSCGAGFEETCLFTSKIRLWLMIDIVHSTIISFFVDLY